MKKLYRKGTVHPSPPIILDHLSFLPAAILTLTAALSPKDREVLAYLISCSNNSSSNPRSQRKNTQQNSNGVLSAKCKSTTSAGGNDHPPLFTCDCFSCYMSYWVKWDASPNRQLIHEIIDAFEDHEMLCRNNNKKVVKNNKKDKKRRSSTTGNDLKIKNIDHHDQSIVDHGSEPVKEDIGDGQQGSNIINGVLGEENGSVRSFVSFVGERIWGIWG